MLYAKTSSVSPASALLGFQTNQCGFASTSLLQIVLKEYLEAALLDQLESHEEFVVKSTADEDIFTMLLSYAAKKLHKQFRDPQRPLPF